MEKITASKLMLCAAALMAISVILLELSGRFVCTACIFAAALCMLGAGLVFRIADKNVEPKGVQKDE